MRARVHRILTAGLVPRATILGMLGSLLAMAPMGALTPAAHAATGTITEFNNSNRPGIIQNSSSDPLGLTVGPDGNLWFTDEREKLHAPGSPAGPLTETGPPPPVAGLMSIEPATD